MCCLHGCPLASDPRTGRPAGHGMQEELLSELQYAAGSFIPRLGCEVVVGGASRSVWCGLLHATKD